MSKKILQITFIPRKVSKNKVICWFQNQWFIVWWVWRPKLISKVCWAILVGFQRMLPKKKWEKVDKEYEEVDIHIVEK